MMIPYLGICLQKKVPPEMNLRNLLIIYLSKIVGNLVCNIVEGKTI